MNCKYKELDYARNIYENGFQSTQHIATELKLIAIYMRRNLGYKPKKLKEEIYRWCEMFMTGYKKELHYKIINSAVNNACKKGSMLINIDTITFYKYEVDYINNLFIKDCDDGSKEAKYSYECKKLMFTLLFKMKLNKAIEEIRNQEDEDINIGKYFKGGQRKYNELKKLAHLPEKVKINEDIINVLWVNGLVTPMFNGLIKLDFIEVIYNIDKNSRDISIVVQIDDYENIGWYFDYYNKDKKISFCKECGRIFRKRSNRQECCSEECSKVVNKNKTKERMENIRKM